MPESSGLEVIGVYDCDCVHTLLAASPDLQQRAARLTHENDYAVRLAFRFVRYDSVRWQPLYPVDL